MPSPALRNLQRQLSALAPPRRHRSSRCRRHGSHWGHLLHNLDLYWNGPRARSSGFSRIAKGSPSLVHRSECVSSQSRHPHEITRRPLAKHVRFPPMTNPAFPPTNPSQPVSSADVHEEERFCATGGPRPPQWTELPVGISMTRRWGSLVCIGCGFPKRARCSVKGDWRTELMLGPSGCGRSI